MLLPVGSRLAYAAVPVDGHKSQPSVGRSCNLVTGRAVLRHVSDYFSRRGIHDRQAPVAFLRDEKPALRLRRARSQQQHRCQTNQ
jgi:hypothetical protein